MCLSRSLQVEEPVVSLVPHSFNVESTTRSLILVAWYVSQQSLLPPHYTHVIHDIIHVDTVRQQIFKVHNVFSFHRLAQNRKIKPAKRFQCIL